MTVQFVAVIISVLLAAALILGSVPASAASAQGTSPPAPTGITATNTGNVGGVRVNWNAVPSAAWYRIGWVAYADYQAAVDAGDDWLETFTFINVANAGQTSHTVTRLTPGADYAFIVASSDARHGMPKWPASADWASLTISNDSSDLSAVGSAAIELSWQPGSTAYYHIGWVILADYEAATEAGKDWLETFTFIDVANRGQASHTITRLTPSVEYAFIVGIKDTRYGAPQWPYEWQYHTPGAAPTSAEGTPGSAAVASTCPRPGSPAAEPPDPTPISAVRGDYDADDDSLIDVANLQQLDAIRYDPRGRGTPTDQPRYEAAFPNAVAGMGCPLDWGCRGYELVSDLDLDTSGNGRADAGDEYWNDGAGWVPIEGYRDFFYGGGHTISNLYIKRDSDYVGLFGDSSVDVSRVALVSMDVSGGDFVGGLAGRAGEIIYSYATGNVSGRHNVGGLVGDGHDIRDSCTGVDVSGEDNVGGLVGDGGYSFISASYATGIVSGDSSVGGLVGHGSNISSSYAIGNVTGQSSSVGGLVGFGRAISDSYATGNVTSQGNLVGGLVGSGGGIISDSYATGDVTSQGKRIGGLVGAVAWNISNSYATGDVTSQGNSVGGLVGHHSVGRNISGSFATGDVSGQHYVGGLVGYHACCGRNIITSYATGNVSGQDFVGGLVGTNNSRHNSISGSYATGEVTGNDIVGGLAGVGANISGSYASGDVLGGNSVGGLTGCGGIIQASYAIGDVSGNSSVGGLVGIACQMDFASFHVNNSISESYAAGSVSGIDDVGGLVGNAEANANVNVVNSYWDTDTSGQSGSAGGEGKPTIELQAPTDNTGIYSNWSDHRWDFGTSSQYPALKSDGLSGAPQR